MNTNGFELAVAHNAPALSLRWINTSEGLRMQWTSQDAPPDERLLTSPAAQTREIPPAVA